jgi:hypothetical protein
LYSLQRHLKKNVLWKTFGLKRDVGSWQLNVLHIEELCELYKLPGLVRLLRTMRMLWAELGAQMGKTRNALRILMGKAIGK